MNNLNTPAFVYNEKEIRKSLNAYNLNFKERSFFILFSLKSFLINDILFSINPLIDGFSVSSLLEAKLSREILDSNKPIHITTPGLKYNEIEEIIKLCDYIAFNSLTQYERFNEAVRGRARCGIRVNPQLPFVSDKRHDPCRKNSKLGVPLDALVKLAGNGSSVLKDVKGIHFHSNSESSDFSHLLKTVQHLDAHIPGLLEQCEWVNMGGGYLFDESNNIDKFHEAVGLLKSKYDVEIFIEPGKGIIGKAGYIVSRVIDIFESDGQNIAVLDTTVNHMPEVFEYQYRPDIAQESENGTHKYILAGCTCLAGDLFGEYRFDEPLEIGSKIVFENMGAYTLVKANMFNGINLPSIYILREDGALELVKEYTYEDFLSRCGGDKKHAPL